METESGNDGRETAKRLMLSGDLKDYINTAHLGRKRKEA